ncbi:MAG: hypothetical protein LCH77_11225 [Actinobacteria bacterium]|nr:hypothetical protein [Actinomycetota bacterium]
MAEEPRKRGKVTSGIVTGLALLAALGLHVLTKQAEAKYYYHVGSCVTVDGFDQADVDCAAKGLRFQVATTVVNAGKDITCPAGPDLRRALPPLLLHRRMTVRRVRETRPGIAPLRRCVSRTRRV